MPDVRPGSPPNIVVVVLDCVRAASFPGPDFYRPGFDRLDELRRESVVYSHAATVAPWTLPSHATLLTGLYPWEHGVMGVGRMRVDPSMETIARVLGEIGYSRIALSANGITSPLLAVDGAFDVVRCIDWWQKTLRWVDRDAVSLEIGREPRPGRAAL